jgi:hypothetical protein
MSPISINSAPVPVSFAAGDDVIAVINAKYAASTEGFRSALQTSCDSAMNSLAKLAQLKALTDKLANAAKADGGKSVILGSDLANGNALKSDIQSIGGSLATEQRYNIIVITHDANGTAVVGAKHLATAAEMNAAQAAAVVPSPYFDVEEYRKGTDANGKPVEYAVYRNESVLTASQADVTALITQFQATAAPIESAARDALARVKAYAGVIEKGIPDPTQKLRKRETQSVDNRLQEQSQSLSDASRQRIEDLERIRLGETASSSGNGPGNG